jgi:hypothetical protein
MKDRTVNDDDGQEPTQESQTMPKQDKNLKQQPSEPRNLLEQAAERLRTVLDVSGPTETEPESDTERLQVSFVPRRATKPSEPPAE